MLKRKTLLFFANDLSFFHLHFFLVIPSLLKDYRIVIAAPNLKNKSIFKYRGCYVITIPMSRGSVSIFSQLKSLFAFYKISSRLRFDIVSFVGIKCSLYGGIISRFITGIRALHYHVGLGTLFLSESITYKLLRVVCIPAFRFGANSKNSKYIFLNESDKSVFLNYKIINNSQSNCIDGLGVSLEAFPFSPKPRVLNQIHYMGLPGRIIRDKGVYEFVAAARAIKEIRSDCRFVLLGDSDLDNPFPIMPEKIIQWVEEGVIEHWGWISNVRDAYSTLDIICLPSYREGLPKVLIEACAFGRPIVTTDVPGCADVVEQGITGELVKPKDVISLKSAMLKLIDNTDLCERYIYAARQRVQERFSDHIINEKIAAIYADLLNDTVVDTTPQSEQSLL